MKTRVNLCLPYGNLIPPKAQSKHVNLMLYSNEDLCHCEEPTDIMFVYKMIMLSLTCLLQNFEVFLSTLIIKSMLAFDVISISVPLKKPLNQLTRSFSFIGN